MPCSAKRKTSARLKPAEVFGIRAIKVNNPLLNPLSPVCLLTIAFVCFIINSNNF